MSEELRSGPSKTTRDFLTDLLRGFGVNNYTANKQSGNLFGTDETLFEDKGNSGLLDLTPLGILPAARRTGRRLGRGEFGSAALEALGVIPGVIPGVGPAAKKAVGTLKTKQLIPKAKTAPLRFGIIDESDNSLVNVISADRVGKDHNITVSTSIPNPEEVSELYKQGILNQQQATDTLTGPRVPSSPDLTDELLLMGLRPGNAVRSGAVTGANTKKHILDVMGEMSLSKEMVDDTGVLFGHRVTGGKHANRAQMGNAAISLPAVRKRAIKKGLKPPKRLKESTEWKEYSEARRRDELNADTVPEPHPPRDPSHALEDTLQEEEVRRWWRDNRPYGRPRAMSDQELDRALEELVTDAERVPTIGLALNIDDFMTQYGSRLTEDQASRLAHAQMLINILGDIY